MSDMVGESKFIARYENFREWLSSFMETVQKNGIFAKQIRLKNKMTTEEMAMYLNYAYWDKVTDFVKPHLKDTKSKKVRINHYKIAATLEYIIMWFTPFVDEHNDPADELNCDFAFHLSLQILFAWNLEKDKIDLEKLRKFMKNDGPTREFIEEHKIWLRYHCENNPYLIFSNMQTMRLFHYWFRGM